MTQTLSESDSKNVLVAYGIRFLPEILATDAGEARAFAANVDGPVVMKLCGEGIAHKTERGLVRLGINPPQVEQTFDELMEAARPEDGVTGVLVAPMVKGLREFLAGVSIDPVFGPTVVFGVGGVLAEAIDDVTVRLVPIRRHDAHDMMDSLAAQVLLGTFRGEAAPDRESIADLLCALSDAAVGIEGLVSVDLNPVMIVEGIPYALDALVEIAAGSER